ncbi:hypothetical protein GRI47_04640 [Erythrobacter pelagi]|uniref:Alpha-glutamyl/putrescinyl thymine pyrophosphorylase clade 3 domain-containing protein n=1 Tax=Qipengyuania pelagi TaxID=994320 RepID=A0A844Y584_9SPHN|nr:hypothetical protein [Qipengyuania pelagi]MXO53294.1 hypothetical protein [Qipengyuania pelagi]
MWPSRDVERKRLETELTIAKTALGLAGLVNQATIETLALQFVASQRREDYYEQVQAKPVSAARADPNSSAFDAERAVAHHMQQGNIDEAGWLIFLMTHFARPVGSKWLRLQDVYGKLGTGTWNWANVTANPAAFYDWLDANWQQIRGKFGNHRKYTSLRPNAQIPMRKTVADYLAWIGPAGHAGFFANAVHAAGNDPHVIFDHLYKEMKIGTFARLGKFDYLSLVGRYGLAPIEAGSAYLKGATGPEAGARLLVNGARKSATPLGSIQGKLDALDLRLKVGMAIMEDALCNWQKSPAKFVHYLG